jgi:hypothetical protein
MGFLVSEMEFLDIIFNKRLESFVSMLFTVPSTGGFKKNPYKKSAIQENSGLFMNIVLKNRK